MRLAYLPKSLIGRPGRYAVHLVLAILVVASVSGCAWFPRPVTVSREQAVAIARATAPDRLATAAVLDTEMGEFKDIGDAAATTDGPAPDPHDPVWRIDLGMIVGPLNGSGTMVVIDARDGHVIQTWQWIT